MKPIKLIDHLKSLHPEHVYKDLEFFTKKKAQFLKCGTLTNLGFDIPQKPLVKASYRVAYRIAKSKKQSSAFFFTVFWPNSLNARYQTLQNTNIKYRVNCLASGNEFFLNNAIGIVKTNQH